MAGIRDVWLGRLRVVTFDDSFQEGVGDALILSGGSAALGARTPKRYALTLPIHGTSLDADEYGAGARMRRQVRSLFENDLARAQGFYLNAWLDPEQNGWLAVGSATIGYVSGGPTLAEYSLVVDEVYRVASDRLYRPGRRLSVQDRRLSTTYRDFLGGRTSTDFAGLTGGSYSSASSFCLLPPGAVDVTGLARAALTTYPVFSREGYVVIVQGQPDGSVLNYEQPFTQRQSGDVVIHDRRSQGDWTPPYVNLVPNPSFEVGVSGVFYVGASGVQSSTQAWSGASSLRVTASAAAYTARQTGIPVVAGQAYSYGVSVYPSNFARALNSSVIVWKDGGGATISGVFLSSTPTLGQWNRYTLTATAPANAVTADVYALDVGSGGASGDVWYVDALSFTATAAPVAYFDGSSPGYAWTGVPHASTSQGPYGWVNPIRNASAKSGTQNWAVVGAGSVFTLTSVPDAAFAPYNALDLAVTGATATSLEGGFTQATDAMVCTPGQTVYVEGWLKLIAALPVGATVSVAAFFRDPNGNGITTPVVGSMTSQSAVGQWVRFSGTVVVPASAYVVTTGITTAGHLASAQIHYRTDNLLVCDASALGAPPTYNPLGYPGTAYFDGDSAMAGWLGSRANSDSVLWLDPQDAPGWEEALGPEHQLTTSDVPVLSNGLARVRAETGQGTTLVFALDWAIGPTPTVASVVPGGGGWVEQGRWSFGIGGSGQASMPAWPYLSGVAVVEWTPDRGVVKVTLTGTYASGTTRHVDVYVTLQRGWDGPRFEVYDCPPAGTAATDYYALWSPNYASAVVAASARVDGGSPRMGAAVATDVAGGLAAGVVENWLAVHPLQPNLWPAAYLVREWDDASFSWSAAAPAATSLYPSGSQPLVVQHFVQPSPSIQYFSQLVSFGQPGYGSPAPAIRNASGTTGLAIDAAALVTPSAPTTTTTTTGGTLPTATSYRYKVVAYDASGLTVGSAQGNSVTTGAGSTNSNTSSWGTIVGAVGYLIYRQTAGAGNFNLVGSTTTASFTDTTPGAQNTAVQPPTSDTTGQTSITGTFVTETQATSAHFTLESGPNTVPIGGTLGLWARVWGFPGDTISLRANASAGATNSRIVSSTGALPAGAADQTYAPATAAWTWVYVGEVPQAAMADVTVAAWVSARAAQNPAASAVAIDSIAAIPTSRGAGFGGYFDGARDVAAAYLYDTRTIAEVVQR